MSWILSISSHYSLLCWWKHAVSVPFSSFRVSHLLCSDLCSCNSRGNLTRKWTTINSVFAAFQIKPLAIISMSIYQLSSVACQTCWEQKTFRLHFLVFIRLNRGQTNPGYWHRTGKGPRHKHCICSPTQEATQHWPFFTFMRKWECVCPFHPWLNSDLTCSC